MRIVLPPAPFQKNRCAFQRSVSRATGRPRERRCSAPGCPLRRPLDRRRLWCPQRPRASRWGGYLQSTRTVRSENHLVLAGSPGERRRITSRKRFPRLSSYWTRQTTAVPSFVENCLNQARRWPAMRSSGWSLTKLARTGTMVGMCSLWQQEQVN